MYRNWAKNPKYKITIHVFLHRYILQWWLFCQQVSFQTEQETDFKCVTNNYEIYDSPVILSLPYSSYYRVFLWSMLILSLPRLFQKPFLISSILLRSQFLMVHLHQPSIVCEHCLQMFANRSLVGVNTRPRRTGFANPVQERSQVSRCLSVNLRMLKEIQCLLRVQCEQHMYVSSAFKFASSCT